MSYPKEKEKEKEKEETILGKKRKKKESNEKEVDLYEIQGKSETFKKKTKIKDIKEFDVYLSSLKNPFTIFHGSFLYLNNPRNRSLFFYNEEFEKIYEKEDNSTIYEDYRLYYKRYEEEKGDSIKILNPFPLSILLLGPNFFFDLPEVNCPKYYRGEDKNLLYLLSYFFERENNIFHLYKRQNSGATLYLMKQMERRHQSFFYLDLRKLNNIIITNRSSMDSFYNEFKKFLFYSLFNVYCVYEDPMEVFQKVEEYYYYILGKISLNTASNNSKGFIENLFGAYIELYKNHIHKILLTQKEEIYQMLIFIIDHYNNEIDIDYINEILGENDDTLKFLITHSFNDKNEITKFFQYIENDTFTPDLISTSKGIVLHKNKTIIGYYEEFYAFDIRNFEGETNILHLYGDELKENFGLINPNYFYRFINFMKDKEQNQKDTLAIQKFIKLITTEIELDIRKFYNNNLGDEYFFISKYWNINFDKKDSLNKKQIDMIKKNLPLNYFILKFSDKNLINIIPSCNLVKKIIEKKSKNFSSVIYQSKYYETIDNNGEKGFILQKAIEEKINNDYTFLFNYSEKTLIFKCEYIIPKAKQVNKNTIDPVMEYYNAIKGLNNNNTNQDISSYMSDIEKNDMKNLSDIFFKETDKYKNIILIENNAYAKNYDLGIIKFTGNYDYIVILCQITVSRDKNKFYGVNIRLHNDICYIIDKIEKYFPKYKSKGVYLFYILDKDEDKKPFAIENISYKSGLNTDLKNKVFLLYFGRKYLKLLTEQGKIIKKIHFSNENIEFITSDVNHYFLDEFIQKIFNKVISIYSIKIGKLYIDNYDYADIVGDCLIISKIDNNLATAVINIEGKKVHTLKAIDKKMKQIPNDIITQDIESYFFEILNPNEINIISFFPEINIFD